MNKIKRTFIALVAVIVIATAPSCLTTDLKEDIYSQILSGNFFTNEEEIIAAMAPAYGGLRTIDWPWCLESYTTDEMVLPTRGLGEWYDGGIYQRYHEHTWTGETDGLNDAWTVPNGWASQANRIIYQFEQLKNMDPDLKASFIGELKVIRAYAYYHLLSLFGNVPIVDRFDVEKGFMASNNANFTAGCQQVFEFIEDDLLDNIEGLSSDKSTLTYGRFNKWAAHALLVKLYMNAEAWTGTPKWDEAISHANAIINSGLYELEPNYFRNFLVNNNGSKENIFVIPYDDAQAGGLNTTMYNRVQHFVGTQYLGVPVSGWNGACALPSHYKSFDPEDLRRNGWLVGLMHNKATGAVVNCTMESAPLPLEYTVDFVNIYDPNDPTVYDYQNAKEYNGARFYKYEYNFNANMGNDLVKYRYADILMLKAEALMRKNGGVATTEAVNLVNQVRSRAFADPGPHLYTTVTLTLDELLADRAREFYYEGMRRTDLVRFGKFVRGTWEWADRSGEQNYRNFFPIPQRQMSINQNLKQNPGY